MRRLWIGIAAVAMSCLIATLLWNRRAPSTGPAHSQSVPARPQAQRNDALPAPEASPTRAPSAAPAQTRAAPEKSIALRPEEKLASVEGSAILGRDIGARTAMSMPLENYRRELDRAIDRELIFRAARARSVELTAAQRVDLERLRAAREKREPGVVYLAGYDPDEIAFQIRDAERGLLQAALLGKSGTGPPQVKADDVQRYYQEHRVEFDGLPDDPSARQQAWLAIDRQIRDRLAPEQEREYQRRTHELLAQLRASAHIVELVSRPR
jgi:hypothetical protein